jgi:hypothetical protein
VILYRQAGGPAVRFAEQQLSGRRIAVRAQPYVGDVGATRFLFDPIEKTFSSRALTGTVTVGPFDPEAWRSPLATHPAGAVLIGPSDPEERIRGAYRAAVEGAASAGRGAYLWDPEPDLLTEDLPRTFVAVFVLLPSPGTATARLSAASRRGILAGGVLPLIPGWTDSVTSIDTIVADAAAAGAAFVAPLSPALDGPARRLMVEARADVEPAAADAFFERIHHETLCDESAFRLSDACRRAGILDMPVRARGVSEPLANSAAAAHLEERAFAEKNDEHRTARLLAAARWVDELGRDLGVIVREGNLGKIFPFGPELARETEIGSSAAKGVETHVNAR